MSSEALRTEYEQVNQNIRALADVRFKLLALIPTVGGIAAFLITNLAFKSPDNPVVLAVSILGFLATLGITFYDQRNSELYNRLHARAKFLEEQLELPPNFKLPASSKMLGGQFRERPDRARRLLFMKVGHDTGLALIYAPILGIWTLPATVFLLSMAGKADSLNFAYVILAIVLLLFFEELLRLDNVWGRLWEKIFKKDNGSLADHLGPWDKPSWESGVIAQCRSAWNKPLDKLTDVELETLLRHKIATEHVLPIVRDRLESNINASDKPQEEPKATLEDIEKR